MKRSHKPTRFKIEDVYYEFNETTFKDLYCYRSEASKQPKKEIVEEIVNTVHKSESSVRDWLKGYNGPSDLETIKMLADVFGCDYMLLLRKCEEENTTMKSIENYERDAARMVYAMMCDVIEDLDFIDYKTYPGDPEPMPMLALYGDIEYLEHARAKKLLDLKKMSFDLPLEIRNQLSDLLNDCFGPYEQHGHHFGIFAGKDYMNYLSKNNVGDNIKSMVKYCLVFKMEVEQRLNHMLNRYMGQ